MRKFTCKVLISSFVFVSLLVAIVPILYIFSNSFMSQKEINERYTTQASFLNEEETHDGNLHFVNMSFIPKKVTLSQYESLFFYNPMAMRMFWNSVLVIMPIILGQFLLAPITAYGFHMTKFRFKNQLFFIYVIIMLMPLQLIIVPNYLVAGWLGIKESYLAIILPAIFNPLGVFIIVQQLKGFPTICLEAGLLDGTGKYQAFSKIVRPNISSVVAAVVILIFADNWNMVDQAIVFIKDDLKNLMSVYLGSASISNISSVFASSVFFMLPAVLIFAMGQEHLAEGISLSAVKL